MSLTLIKLFHNIFLKFFEFYIHFYFVILIRKLSSLITPANTVDLKSLKSDTPNKLATPTKQPIAQPLSQLAKLTSKTYKILNQICYLCENSINYEI